jgi:hypothetical protein
MFVRLLLGMLYMNPRQLRSIYIAVEQFCWDRDVNVAVLNPCLFPLASSR